MTAPIRRTAHIEALLAMILDEDDPVRRNRMITRCYLDIALALADVVGRRDLTWFAFGAWASGTAGATIRRESALIDRDTAAHIAAGNLAIIANVAPAGLAWLREVEREGSPTERALEQTLTDPMFAGAPHLASAIGCYHAAAALGGIPTGAKDAAELMLLGNLRIGEHEQALVDTFIDAAMPLGGPFGLITTRFVSISTPDGDLDVCRDVPAPSYLAPAFFPADLCDLRHAELLVACTAYGQSPGSDVSASNAWIWEDFVDRMGFIFTFLRAYQQDARYFEVPPEWMGGSPHAS